MECIPRAFYAIRTNAVGEGMRWKRNGKITFHRSHFESRNNRVRLRAVNDLFCECTTDRRNVRAAVRENKCPISHSFIFEIEQWLILCLGIASRLSFVATPSYERTRDTNAKIVWDRVRWLMLMKKPQKVIMTIKTRRRKLFATDTRSLCLCSTKTEWMAHAYL